MSDVQRRLVSCFMTVFPDLSPTDALEATPMTVPAWDSVTTLTLLTVLEDEFAVNIDYEKAGELSSFRDILALLEGRAG